MNVADSLKTPERRKLEKFFGKDLKFTSNNYFTFRSFINRDTVIVLTNNVKYIHNNPVLIIAKNKGVYLKEWQLREVKNIKEGIQCYAVSLKREYFKSYEFNFEFNDIILTGQEEEFNYWCDLAKQQDKEPLPVKEVLNK